jgi:uncharacterized protein (DUF433 family)
MSYLAPKNYLWRFTVKKILLIGTVVILLIMGVAGVVYAQEEEPPVDPEGEGPFGGFGHGRFRQHSPIWDEMLELLADQFGLTVDELSERLRDGEKPLDIALEQGLSEEDFQGMMEEIRDEVIDNALSEGLITEEQAELMPEHWGEGWSFKGSPAGYNFPIMSEVHELMADRLGLTVEELSERVKNGETLLDIALAQGMNEEDFTTMRADVHEEVLNNAVAEGTISEEQADQIRERMEEGGPFNGRRGTWGQFPQRSQMLESLAEELGLDIEELRERIEDGEQVHDLLEEYGLNLEDIHEKMEDFHGQGFRKLRDGIESGKFTPEQIELFRECTGERPFKRNGAGFQFPWKDQQ